MEKIKVGYMAVSNQSRTIRLANPKKHPRKQLMDKLGYKHCEKIYVDDKTGTAKHIGYVIGREWFTIYEVCEWCG